MLLTWDRLLSLLVLIGKVRFSETQYAILRGAINTCNERVAMLDVHPIHRTLRSALHGYCYSKSEIVYIEDNPLADLYTDASPTVQSGVNISSQLCKTSVAVAIGTLGSLHVKILSISVPNGTVHTTTICQY